MELDRIEIESAGSDPERLAAALLRQLPDLDGRVPIDEIALALDIVEIVEAPLVGLEGCLQTDALKSEGQIVVRAASPPQRRRFTIAHELGHFLNERHRPTGHHGFACTAQDMRSPAREGVHRRQEREANAFAIEALMPRRLLGRHLKRTADLEHALAIAARFDVSRAAAVRRYVALHEEALAVLFTRHGVVLYLDKAETFPWTAAWKGDAIGHLLPSPGADRLGSMNEVQSEDWIAGDFRGGVFAQTLFQDDGYAMTLLLAEPDGEER